MKKLTLFLGLLMIASSVMAHDGKSSCCKDKKNCSKKEASCCKDKKHCSKDCKDKDKKETKDTKKS